MQIHLVELVGENEFSETVELDQDVLSFGRGISGDGFVSLPKCAGNWVSRFHCTIYREKQKWFICDGQLGGKPSKKGILFKGQRIAGPIQLEAGQIFTLLTPPPCEIQLRVVEGHRDLEDTLIPALGPAGASASKPTVLLESLSLQGFQR